jgi:hypothetical protein
MAAPCQNASGSAKALMPQRPLSSSEAVVASDWGEMLSTKSLNGNGSLPPLAFARLTFRIVQQISHINVAEATSAYVGTSRRLQ